MVVGYIVAAVFLVLGAVLAMRGAYLIYRGIRYEDPYGDFFRGVRRLSAAACLGMSLWAIGFPWNGAWFEWVKMFVDKYALILNIVAGVLFLAIGLPLICFFVCIIKWLFIDTRKKASGNETFLEDDTATEE